MQDLRTIHERQRKRFRELYDTILKDCTTKIRHAAQLKKLRVTYELPLLQEGIPLYDARLCKKYLIKSLDSQGFECTESGTRLLTISWKSAVRNSQQHVKEVQSQKVPSQKKASDTAPPPLPPITGKNDLFALPSIRNLQATARGLRR